MVLGGLYVLVFSLLPCNYLVTCFISLALLKRLRKSVRSLPLLYHGDFVFPDMTVTLVLGQSSPASLRA